ncbi:alpha/beta hydrolase [Microlunatus capsulatus]|uniref:Alpha-beta hydrolase superfamily lysophospholipase n=1 Tax=Microlunatus capsulatus TaxID=99117 RepID=A0ABS4Z885_9ACTN|nr:alpha/beta hydrolase [Microlunatus capsulatus]MBP2416945.1 alpha-beta hydrolase superfamily lysophospholipase [Microlunatus capsulatus]
MRSWHPDLLPGYESTELPLPGAPAAGEPAGTGLVATLVRRAGQPRGDRRPAVLYVHGWNDYFFQTHLADALEDLGLAFYALDLRRYGRSLRPGQLRGFVTDLAEHFEELDAAAAVLAEDHDGLLLVGHSTGGLVSALWAAARPGRVDALVLNSPWLDLQGSALVRTVGSPIVDALGSRNPTSVLRLPPDLGHYARVLHADHGGEWTYDTALKSSPSPPVRAGWLRAVLAGHQKVAAGLGLEVPVLVLASATSDFGRRWHEGLRGADTVLDVEQIALRAVRLGRHVTLVRVPDGVHDLVLSAPAVRASVLATTARWVRAYGPVPSITGGGDGARLGGGSDTD